MKNWWRYCRQNKNDSSTMDNYISSALKDWMPYRISEEGENINCRWLYLGDEKITEPFFEDTIGKCRKLTENSRLIRCVSNVEVLPEWAKQIDTIAPTAFIFHISRCGSTLISQLLGLQPANIVLSEVPFFDELLRWGNKNNCMPATLPLLKAAIELVAAKRDDNNTHLFIKTDSWQVHFYNQLRELYPKTPFILLYRRPDEVIRSQQKNRGMQAIPGLINPEIFGFDKNEILQLSLDEYMAKVIESYLQAFIEILKSDTLALPVNYNEGTIGIVNKIAAFTGITINDEEMEMMKERSGFHGKYPGQFFREAKMEEPPHDYLKRAFELYDEAERIRTTR
jgi:hypothetical protein